MWLEEPMLLSDSVPTVRGFSAACILRPCSLPPAKVEPWRVPASRVLKS